MVLNQYRLIANSDDITNTIRERLVSLRCSDSSGIESDTLEITLADHLPDKPIEMPATGAELELFIGEGDSAQRMGMFVVDEVELAGFPGTMTIRARGAVFEQSKAGKTQLQSQKTRSWDKNTKLVDVVNKIASEHQLKPQVAASLKSVTLPMLAQTDESDISFLTRICRKYDAVCKPANGYLLVTKHGEAKTASGEDISAIKIDAKDVTSFSLQTSRRESSGTVVSYWGDTKAGKRYEIKVGSGEPVRRIKMQHASRQSAIDAAKAELRRRNRGKTKLSLRMPGNPEIFAEAPIELTGFRDAVNGTYIIERVEHSLSGSGYQTTIEAVIPNDESEPAVTETVQRAGKASKGHNGNTAVTEPDTWEQFEQEINQGSGSESATPQPQN